MLRFISTLAVLFFIHIVSPAQHYEFAWQNCFGGTGEDVAYGIAQTDDGYIVVGDTRSTDGDVTINYGGLDGWVVRLDQVGQMIWQRSYGGSNGDDIYDVFDAEDGNFLLAGGTASQNGTIDHNPYPGTWSYWFMKIDGEGNIIWQTIAGGPNTNWLWGAYPTADGGIIGVGEIYGVGGDISVFYGAVDAWVVKLDANGQVEWDFTVGSPPMPYFSGVIYGNSVIQTSDGGFLVAANGGVGPNGSIDCIPMPQSGAVGILVKLDANGQHEWSGCYGGVNGNESLLDVVEVADGYVFTGIAASTDGDLAGCGLHNPSTTDLWVAKIDFEGNLLWMHCYGGTSYEVGMAVVLKQDGGLVVAGKAESHDGDVTSNNGMYGNPNIWLVWLNDGGELLHEASYGAGVRTSLHTRNNLIAVSDNRFTVAGTTRSKPHHPPEHQGNVDCGNTHTGSLMNFDWWVFEIYDTTVFVQEHYHAELLKVFPNPATDQAWLQLPENMLLAQVQIELYSPTGRLLYKAKPTSHFHKIDVAHLPKGLYLVKVWDGERWYAEKLVVR